MSKKIILQYNLARSWNALHLLARHVEELDVGVCAVSEPRHVPDSPYWFGSDNGLAVIFWRKTNPGDKCRMVLKCRDFVVVEYAGVYVIACYISPNAPHQDFLTFLDDLGAVVRQLEKKVMICGDFNFKSVFWGCTHTDVRGRLLEEWASEYELRLLNTGNTPTCVRPQGCSVVDLTWCTPDILGRLHGWSVTTDIESLSDHSYIVVGLSCGVELAGSRGPSRLRWSWKSLNIDIFRAAIFWEVSQLDVGGAHSLDEGIGRMERAFQRACDAAMDRIRLGSYRKQVYWWNETVAQARRESIRARRLWSRTKIRNRDATLVQTLRETYNATRKNLNKEIRKTKANAWQELINMIEEDPWGLPNRVVLQL